MKSKTLLLIIPLILVGCTTTKGKDNSANSGNSNSSIFSSEDPSSQDGTTSYPIVDDSYVSSIEEITDYEQYIVDPEFDHYLTMNGLPKNHGSPVALSSYNSNLFQSHLPDNFRYAYSNSYDDGPSGKRATPNFYSSNEHQGLKIAQEGLGFQTYEFTHTGSQLDISINYQLYAKSGQPTKDRDTARIYFYTNTGALIGQHNVHEGTLESSQKINYLKFSWTYEVQKVAYFEFRLLTFHYKGNQRFNMEVIDCEISVK